jgi:uncharacterized membrane protein
MHAHMNSAYERGAANAWSNPLVRPDLSDKAILNTARPTTMRIPSVDILRGLAIVVMTLDHTRDWFSSSSVVFDPTDLSHTTPILFLTRWITHFCAPIFVFLAGSGAYLSLQQSKDSRKLAQFLFSRGVWLVFLEFFVISPFGWSFALSFAFTRLQVIWVIGVSMILLSGLVLLLPSRVIGYLGVAMILLHDVFDGSNEKLLGPMRALHQVTFFTPFPHRTVGSLYPVIPWVGVMMAGYAAGELLTLPAEKRRRTLISIGAIATILFLLLRAVNTYGDPSPWSIQSSPALTMLSILRCSKYPPSLLYLLMTLGPALILLGALERPQNRLTRFLEIYGKVPLFYYLMHLPLLHGLAVLLSLLKYGNASWLYQDSFTLQRSLYRPPVGYGFDLRVVYSIWLAIVLALYPACKWFAAVKRSRKEAFFRYL